MPELSPVAQDVKRVLGKRGKTAARIADNLGRSTGKGLGPVLRNLLAAGVAVCNEDGTYSKA
jgi:hypothetical protein